MAFQYQVLMVRAGSGGLGFTLRRDSAGSCFTASGPLREVLWTPVHARPPGARAWRRGTASAAYVCCQSVGLELDQVGRRGGGRYEHH